MKHSVCKDCVYNGTGYLICESCGSPTDSWRFCNNCKYAEKEEQEEPCLTCGDAHHWEPGELARKEPDDVNHPDHYTQGEIDCIDAIRAALTPEEWRGYLKGNCLKYIWRERLKGSKDIEKAEWYIRRLLGDV